MKPKLSVLVPAFKLEDYIESCLQSLLSQETDFPFEVIVCDDASPDGTASIIKSLESTNSNLIAIYKKENGGLAQNMASLFDAAQGEYIAYLDGDDIALPSKLQKQVDYLEQNLECNMVFHESEVFDSDTGETLSYYSESSYNWALIPDKSDVTHLVRYGTYMQASSVMFRNHSELSASVPEMCKIILDYPFYIKNAGLLGGTIDFIPEVLGRYRIHQNSFGAQTSRSAERRLQSLKDIETACIESGALGVSSSVIHEGITHHRFAAALYFLFRESFDLFKELIESSHQYGLFFNEKHRTAWQMKNDPEQLLQKLSSR